MGEGATLRLRGRPGVRGVPLRLEAGSIPRGFPPARRWAGPRTSTRYGCSPGIAVRPDCGTIAQRCAGPLQIRVTPRTPGRPLRRRAPLSTGLAVDSREAKQSREENAWVFGGEGGGSRAAPGKGPRERQRDGGVDAGYQGMAGVKRKRRCGHSPAPRERAGERQRDGGIDAGRQGAAGGGRGEEKVLVAAPGKGPRGVVDLG